MGKSACSLLRPPGRQSFDSNSSFTQKMGLKRSFISDSGEASACLLLRSLGRQSSKLEVFYLEVNLRKAVISATGEAPAHSLHRSPWTQNINISLVLPC